MSDSEYLDFRLLKYIVAVAEEGTFTAAAARLNLSQSALSTQIKTLEENLGIKIFDRERGATLTAEGKVLLRYGRQGLKTRDHIVATVKAIHAGKMMPLRLAFSPFVLNPLLRTVTDLYRELIPDGEIIPESDGTEEIVQWLHNGDCDAALVTLPVESDELEITILESHQLVVCLRQDDPLASMSEIPPQALDGKISVFTYQKYHPRAYERLIQMFGEIGVTTRPCKPTLNIEHIQWLVKEGGCYSLMRSSRPLAHGLVTRPIAGIDWTIDTAIACPKDNANPALSLLIEELKNRLNIKTPNAHRKPPISVGIQAVNRSRKEPKDDVQIPLFRVGTAS